MIVGTAVVSIAVFAYAIWRFGVASVAAEALATSRQAVTVLRDSTLDDRAREHAVRHASLGLFANLASMLLRSALAVAAAVVPIGVASLFGLAAADSVFRVLTGWEAAVMATAAAAAAYGIGIQTWRSS